MVASNLAIRRFAPGASMTRACPRRDQPHGTVRLAMLLLAVLLMARPAGGEPDGKSRSEDGARSDNKAEWYRGNTHAHTLWSDGNEFPEMVVDWYKRNGYDFLAISDHNTLHTGERWMTVKTARQRAGEADVLEQYIDRLGADWVQTRTRDGAREVRLQPLSKYRSQFEAPGEFLLLQGEEISDGHAGKPIHLNAVNLKHLIESAGGSSVRDVMRRNLQAARVQAKQQQRPILVHVNHPNFGWAISGEDLAHVVEERFFEVYNGHPHVNTTGDENHPSDEQKWDIANTIRMTELDAPPLFGLATDDSHRYHGGNNPPGRGWIMVRAQTLSPEALLGAMRAGDFYASTGVRLTRIAFDAEAGRLKIKIDPEPGVSYTTRFIGTRVKPANGGHDTEAAPGQREPGPVGEVLAKQQGTTASYTLAGNELYVRAMITASTAHPAPSFEGQHKQAWTQPVGWRHRVGRFSDAPKQTGEPQAR
jgi:hypothetical protein